MNTNHPLDNIRDMILGLDTPVKLSDGRIVPAINLDNAATAPAFKQVADEIQHQMHYYGSIGRGTGQKSAHSSEIYTAGRDMIKKFLGADDNKYTVFYTGCTTDGMNKLASALITSHQDMILSTRMEHHANDLPWRERARTVYAEVDSKGRLILADVERLLKKYNGKIKYVTVTAASNVTGYVNDVHQIAQMAHSYGAQIIVDGAQIVAHRAFSMAGTSADADIDFFVFSAHKMYSPYGGGAVVGLADVLNQHIPKFYGGGMVDLVTDDNVLYTNVPDLYEAGSPNYPGVVGMLEAMKILDAIGFDAIADHEQRLLKRTLNGRLGLPGITFYGDNHKIYDRVGILVFNFDGIDCEIIANELADRAAIAVRHAKFCAHPYVQRLLERPKTNSHSIPSGMVRISFGVYNTEEEVDYLVKTIRELRGKLSAIGMKKLNASSLNILHDRG